MEVKIAEVLVIYDLQENYLSLFKQLLGIKKEVDKIECYYNQKSISF